MKKLTFVFLAFIALTAVTSCNLDYTCTCTFPNNTTAGYTKSYNGVSKSSASSSCVQENNTASKTGGYCSLQ